MNVRTIALVLALACAACSSNASKGEGFPPPAASQGFPRSASDEGVYAEASYELLDRDVFDVDLAKAGIIPVYLKIQLRGEGMSTKIIRLDEDRWDMRLYLQDGTVLSAIDPGDFAPERAASRSATSNRRARAGAGAPASDGPLDLRGHALEPTLLGEQATEGYVFFKLAPAGNFRADGGTVYHMRADGIRPLRVSDSLVAFNVSIEDAVRPFYVGIR
jgi:hypothetical protein